MIFYFFYFSSLIFAFTSSGLKTTILERKSLLSSALELVYLITFHHWWLLLISCYNSLQSPEKNFLKILELHCRPVKYFHNNWGKKHIFMNQKYTHVCRHECLYTCWPYNAVFLYRSAQRDVRPRVKRMCSACFKPFDASKHHRGSVACCKAPQRRTTAPAAVGPGLSLTGITFWACVSYKSLHFFAKMNSSISKLWP